VGEGVRSLRLGLASSLCALDLAGDLSDLSGDLWGRDLAWSTSLGGETRARLGEDSPIGEGEPA
jgi:hypothetical protein